MLFSEYINSLIQKDKCYFTLTDAQETLGKSIAAVRSSIAHYVAKKKLVKVVNGFYAIIPTESQNFGCIMPEKFVSGLMQHLGYEYYAGLLTAAMYHGAAHQSPQVYQIVISKKRPAILSCGKYEIHFLIKKDIFSTDTQKLLIQQSIINVSIPESTVFDLLLYPKSSGGINHIVTILSELKESIDPEVLKRIVEKQQNIACKQRLGYLLEFINASNLAATIYENLSKETRVPYVPLSIKNKANSSTKRNGKWHIIENIKIKSDL